MQATPSAPVAVPPIVADPAPVEPVPAPVGAPRRRRRPVWPWVAAVVLLIAVGALGFAALTSGTGSNSGTGQQAGGGSSSSPGSPKTSSSSSGTSDQATAMEQFITSYLSTVTSDDRATFAMLTPEYQAESGHYGGYHGFWKTVQSATPHHVTADPAAMTVTYDVDYVTDKGGTTTDHVTLQLVKNGSAYLIAGES
jgi:hypothetical protein